MISLKTSYRSAFTLVELIVVITILAILGTVGFVSIQGYSSKSRDTVRASDVVNISKLVDIVVVERGSAPIPVNGVTYTGGTVQIISGTATNSNIARLSEGVSDPITKTPYNYAVFGSGAYYQVGAAFENPRAQNGIPLGIPEAYADSVAVSKILGNYQFNPTLPSLFPISSTISSASGGIFATDGCFVLDNSVSNSFTSTGYGCTKTRDLPMVSYDSGLLSYWDMETLSGSLLKDLSGNGYDANFAGGLSYGTSLTGGKVGRGIHFPGATNSGYHLNISKIIPEQNSPRFSMIALVRLDSFTTPSSGIWGYFGTGGLNCHFEFIDQNNLRIRMGGLNKSTIAFTESGKFTQIAYTYDGIKVIVYINGKKIDEFSGDMGTVFGTSATTPYYFIGNSQIYPGFNRPFNGVIDDIKIFNRVLSPSEIIQNARIAGY